MSKEKRWVYRAGFPYKINIKPTRQEVVKDEHGFNISMTKPAVNLVFNKGNGGAFLVIDDNLANIKKTPAETLVKWLESQPTFGLTFFCVDSPDKLISKEEVEKIEEQIEKVKVEPKVVHGVRTTTHK